MIGNILSSIEFTLLGQGYQIGMDWLGQFARVIIEGCGSVGLGIIVFTLVLKAITLPFDIYQRVKMRKQNLIMRDMKEDLDKLQQQYANDKNMYNQKMMELYKKNGYSMLGACLPMILSLVILIVAFQGFRSYSQYANLDLFVGMSESYNAAILEKGVVGPNYASVIQEENDEEELSKWLFAKPYRLHKEGVEDDEFVLPFEDGAAKIEDGIVYEMFLYSPEDENGDVSQETVQHYMRVYAQDESRYVEYIYNLDADAIYEAYRFDKERLLSDPDAKAWVDEKAEEIAEQNKPAEGEEVPPGTEASAEDTACTKYVIRVGALAAADYYDHNDPGFLWIKNIWYPDVAYSHPIPSTYKTFQSQLNVKVTIDGKKVPVTNVLTKPLYENLTTELSAAQKAPNGYFILIVLSIGMMVLSQFLTMRSQKEANQYQTVDGQGARTQKIMLIMMPLLYAVFAFMYSAAFSIYMTVSSAISLVVTLLSNYFIGLAFKKKDEKKIKEEYGRTLSWMKEDKKGGKKGKKNKKN